MKKIMLLVFLLLLVGSVSAMDWDNGLKYEKNDLKVIVENGYFFGIGEWFGLNEDIGTAELKSHSSVNYVKKVGAGNQVVMWYDFDFKGEYKNGLGEVIFTNETNGEEIERDYSFVYWGEEEYEIPIYSDKMINSITEAYEQIGTETKTRETWLPYDSKDIPKGNIRIGLRTYVEVGDAIDGIWTIAGKKVKKHAEWTAELNVDLEGYWKWDETSGTNVSDSVNGHDGVADSAITWKAGKINNCGSMAQDVEIPLSSNPNLTGTVASFGGWVNTTDNAVGDAGIIWSIGTTWYMTQTSNTIRCRVYVGEYIDASFTGALDENTWVHAMCVKNATGILAYKNGNLEAYTAVSGAMASGNVYLSGDGASNTNNWKGELDEIGAWSRDLTAAEITQLYNGGTGISYTTVFPSAPTSTINAPANLTTVTNPTVVFNATGTDDVTLQNMSLIINGTRVSTNTSVFNNTLTQFPYTLTAAGFWNFTVEACDDDDSCINATLRGITYSNDLAITLNAPANATTIHNPSVVFNATGKDDTTLQNMSLIVNGSYISTNSSVFNNTLTQFPHTLSPVDSFYNWTIEACDNLGACLNATEREFTYTNSLAITLNAPVNALNSTSQTILFNGTGSDDTTLANISMIVNGSYNGTNSSVFNNTFTTFSRVLADGFYNWTMEACDDIGVCLNATVRNLTIASYFEHLYTSNSTSLETESETFYINITARTAPTIGKLIYNGTTHSSATITNTAGNDYNISKTIDIPIVTGNKSFHFNFTIEGTEYSTTSTNQTINLTNFTHFTTGTPFINISFINETLAQELVNSTIDSDWYYWLGSGDVVKTLSFTNASENAYYTFLLVGANRTLNTNVSLTYSNSISQQRNYANGDLELTNATTNLSLYLLPTTDGIYVTFQVINLAQQPLAGVSSNATRSGILISSGTTDDAGSVTYFLDPDTSYQFYFALSGYSTYTTTFAPSQTTYTITMSVTAAGVTEDYTRGINYSFSPGIETLTNNTLTFFNFSLTSSYWTVSDYGFNLTNQDGTRVNASNESADGGTVYVYHNTSDDTSLTMTYYWIVTGNITSGSFTWVVFDGTGTGFGIKTFTDRTATYLSEGIFGINANSMVILIYLIIFVSVGIMSLKFGIRSPATITMVLFGLSFLFEIHLGLIPSVGGVPLLTTVIGIIVAISIIREQLKI